MNRENQHHHLPPKLFDLNDFKVFLSYYIIFFILYFKHIINIYHSFLHCILGGKDDDGSFKSGMGMSGSSSLSKKQRKARTAFTDHQLQTLEKSFERQKYLSVQDRMELANKLGLSDTQVNNTNTFVSLH